MPLDKYFEKRNFQSTPEPRGDTPLSSGNHRFVVQRHEARKLHYDLRLEVEGVLKCWAIPKGPSMNPDDKRLAVMTEDHPIEYLDFHGEIPKGNYGAGTMTIWDKGDYEPAYDMKQGFAKGHLKFNLFGKKLNGEFSLVLIKGDTKNQWLFIKGNDHYATDKPYDSEEITTPLTSTPPAGKHFHLHQPIQPMLAKKVDKPFDDKDWIYELKWDGYRAISSNLNNKLEVYSRNGISYIDKFPPIAYALHFIKHDVVLDGEIVLVDNEGRPNFSGLQNYNRKSSGELRYYVFDILHLNGHDTYNLPLTDRKSLIPDVIEGAPSMVFCDHVEGMGTAFYNRAIENGMEGIMAKKANSLYSPGIRTENWLKIKSHESEEAIICGYTEGEGSRAYFGSLILGTYQDDKLTYIGNCGSGFNDQLLKDVYEKMTPLITDEMPFENKPNFKGRKATWIKPKLICEVTFSEWTPSGNMRHPVFKGLRHDKELEEVYKEEKLEVVEASAGKDSLEVDGVNVHFSNLDKLYWPDEGLTKYDLIEYYLAVSDYIVPYLKDRPQSLLRHPNGITKEGFFHKDTGDVMPSWVETVKVYSSSSEKDINYSLCQNTPSLLHLANLGCIELNPWHSRVGKLDHPDYTIIDLDPGEKTTFEDAIEVALAAKDILKNAQIPSFPKTSGSRGLHIYIPLGDGYSYEEARDFTHIICYMIHAQLPQLTSLERSPAKRKDKIYLDYLQNRKGQTLAAPYCVRPKPGATVSTPLSWGEVKQGLKKEDFNIHTVPNRLQKTGDLFDGLLTKKIDMAKCLERLENS